MLRQQFRLPSSVRFRNAHIVVSPLFVVKIAPNNLDVSRFGFVVSKKVDKRAVARNRVKRQVRSGIEMLFQHIQAGHDVLFIIKQPAIHKSTEVLCNEVRKILKKNGLVAAGNEV